MHETFIDLDELIILCRDKEARKFIQEAVACYRVGAYRSCIVSTWNAVVFDFIHKLRQLDQVGNGDASQLLIDFEHINQNSDFRRLWEFESNIPELALTRFEFISPIEKIDITRLFEDRSRCAHPSMASLEEPFGPTAELARYHLRSAVIHLLQRPPVQGRTAVDRIWQDIKSTTFPVDPELAAQYFQKGLLARVRPSLIRNIVIGLTVSLLTKDLPDDERERQISALNAIAIMYRQEVGEILNDKLSTIILDKVIDEDWGKVIIYLRKVSAWENISEPCKIRAVTFIKNLNISRQSCWNEEEALVNAAYIEFLRDSVKEKLLKAPLDIIFGLQDEFPDVMMPFLQERLKESTESYVFAFIQSSSFRAANDNASKLYRISNFLTVKHKEAILNAFCENTEINGSFDAPSVIKHLFNEDIKRSRSIEQYWLSFRRKLDEKFPKFFEELKTLIDEYSAGL